MIARLCDKYHNIVLVQLQRCHARIQRRGQGSGPQPPWKITNSIRLYRNMQLDPSPWEKLDPLEMLDRPSPWNIGKLWLNDSFL